jgi:cation transporter-like permease
MSDTLYKTSDEKNENVKNNLKTIFVYSLCLAVSLGINTLFISIFNKFSYKNMIISQIIYVVFLIIVITLFTFYFDVNIKRF